MVVAKIPALRRHKHPGTFELDASRNNQTPERRSASGSDAESTVPEGRSKYCQSQRYLSSKLSPGMSKRQRVECSCRFRNAQILLLKSSGPMGSVQSSRWDAAIFLMIPGTSCLATIVLSLWDKTIRPSKRLTIILALMG
jgi:hypothetical protein